MDKRGKLGQIIVGVSLLCFIASGIGHLNGYSEGVRDTGVRYKAHYENNYTLAPQDTRFLMWVEECPLCGGELECEYSIVSDLGHKGCKTCNAGFEFTGTEGVVFNEGR